MGKSRTIGTTTSRKRPSNMATRKSAKKQPHPRDEHPPVHPLARRCADNAWLLLKAQSKYANPHQLGVAAERAGHAAKNTIRNIFYPEQRPKGKNDLPTAPSLDSLEAAAKALGVPVHDFLDPELQKTLAMRKRIELLQQMLVQYRALFGDFDQPPAQMVDKPTLPGSRNNNDPAPARAVVA